VSYANFLARKKRVFTGAGISHQPSIPDTLYPWQRALVRWALRKGRAAIFADCGLGKTFMQVAWADALRVRTLLLAPLCVAEQTVAEAAKLGIQVLYARHQDEAADHRLVITNYERLDQFEPGQFGAVVLDESSILKAFDGKTRTALIQTFRQTPYRLCCTATPSPNDISELANHAEFLGLMTRPEFLATWFIRVDQGLRTVEHHGWRMKRHAVEPFYRWLASWAVALRGPSDLGYDAGGFALPPLRIHEHTLPTSATGGDTLFPEMGVKGLSGRLAARRTALTDRVDAVSALMDATPGEQWVLWCGLNEESDTLAGALPDAVDVAGADTYAHKVASVQAFVRGDARGTDRPRAHGSQRRRPAPDLLGRRHSQSGRQSRRTGRGNRLHGERPLQQSGRLVAQSRRDRIPARRWRAVERHVRGFAVRPAAGEGERMKRWT
jgi:hypothetical protein